jgi:hypothetical protein
MKILRPKDDDLNACGMKVGDKIRIIKVKGKKYFYLNKIVIVSEIDDFGRPTTMIDLKAKWIAFK